MLSVSCQGHDEYSHILVIDSPPLFIANSQDPICTDQHCCISSWLQIIGSIFLLFMVLLLTFVLSVCFGLLRLESSLSRGLCFWLTLLLLPSISRQSASVWGSLSLIFFPNLLGKWLAFQKQGETYLGRFYVTLLSFFLQSTTPPWTVASTNAS